ncbi:MAG: GTP cyclohydrolase I, partial [Verrucomicrobiales bacterium]
MSELKDTQNELDERHIAIDRVGVKALRYPVEIKDKESRKQSTVAMVSLAVDLPHHYK